VNWCYLIVIPAHIFIMVPIFLLMDIQTFKFLLETWDFWYVTINGLALGIFLSILFRDARITIAGSYSFDLLFCCCMDALPIKIRKFTSLLAFVVSVHFFVSVVCVHYNFYPYLQDWSFEIHGIQWSIRQLFITTAIDAMIYLAKFTVLTLYKSETLMMLRARIVPVQI